MADIKPPTPSTAASAAVEGVAGPSNSAAARSDGAEASAHPYVLGLTGSIGMGARSCICMVAAG